MKKVGVVLSGCGVYDGTEIQEAVLTLLALSKHEVDVIAMAPDTWQHHVINHMTGEEMPEKRNVLIESSRIVRGKIRDIKSVDPAELDAIIFPGGFGAAKNLCTFAFKGPECVVDEGVARLVQALQAAGKPIGAICIAPALVGKIFEGKSLKLTIGNEQETADMLAKLGQCHENRAVSEICVDEAHSVVTTPAYMLAQNIAEANAGIERLVERVVRMIK